MITGATLMNYRERYSTKVYIRKRILKTLIPYITWCITWLFACLLIGEHKEVESFSIRYFLDGILTGNVGTYWFFIPLFCIYIFIPIFSLIPDFFGVRRNDIHKVLYLLCPVNSCPCSVLPHGRYAPYMAV